LRPSRRTLAIHNNGIAALLIQEAAMAELFDDRR
jgi:hypothetical protein